MFASFRLSMAWLHTWLGLVFGFVLVVVFFFGSLSVFDREIDRWSIPATRFAPQPFPSFEGVLEPAFRAIQDADPDDRAAAAARVEGPVAAKLPLMDWSVYTTHRDPVLTLYASFALPNAREPGDHIHGHRTLDPRDGRVLPEGQLKIGSQFFYPMHYGLHLHWMNLGYWIVGLSALVMLAALVSGVVIHRKVFRELFTFRPGARTLRSALDLHNLTGVVALPFHFMFALSGLIIFAGIYFPIAGTTMKAQALAFEEGEAKRKGLPYKPAGKPAALAPVDPMVAEARKRWAARGMGGDVGFLFVNHVGDANAYVSIYRAGTDRVSLTGEGIHFEGTTGRVLHEEPANSAVRTVTNFVTGLHLQHFRHWLLRWLYLVGGLAGAACIATGFLFFVEKRKRRHAEAGSPGARWVDAFAVGTVTGTLVATLSMLIGNRLLPEALEARGTWEEGVFWSAWVLAFIHAAWRTAPVGQGRIAPAWAEQCWAVAALAIAAVVLNAVTTGDHLLKTIGDRYWPVAGVDLVLLAVSALAITAALRLRKRTHAP